MHKYEKRELLTLQLPGGVFLAMACPEELGGGLDTSVLLQHGARGRGPEHLPGGGSKV